MTEQLNRRRVWLYPVLLLGGVATGWFILLLTLDTLWGGAGPGLASALTARAGSHIQNALGNLPEVVVAVLGIAITVVSIILQLSATRYTPRVTEMFFRDRTNLLVLGFFVVTSIHCIWATFTVHDHFFPHILVVSTIVMMTGAILVLIPYFIYVFAFLEPERVVARLQKQSLAEALGSRSSIPLRQAHVLQSIEQLADVAVNAIAQKDRIIASRSVDALRDLANSYITAKGGLDARFFALSEGLRKNPDFVVMASDRLTEIESSRTWLEWKVLRQFQTIFNESINRMRDIGQLVAINGRYIGEQALAHDDRAVLQLTIKFFNTFMRTTLNSRDVRTAYNVLHQYRQLAEATLKAGWNVEVLNLAKHFKYYGQTANQMGLPFVTETAANDLCQLCEVAHDEGFEDEAALLDTFLDVDKIPETDEEDKALRGVRKAQVKLATYYLKQGSESLARRIFEDMEHERGERLLNIRDEMLEVKDRDFWEINDRGVNFDYLESSRRKELERFYGWFGHRFTKRTEEKQTIKK
ncbi:MAG: DUF2254 domain-containing protein [Deltaproteobacteria bacterium]|nr:DUF2254 domain-containing protein [Deltaproteobacteria bacterium]